jgi:hypothetical protein
LPADTAGVLRCAVPTLFGWSGVGYIFGLGGNKVLLRKVAALAGHAAVARLDSGTEKVRRWGELDYAAKGWPGRLDSNPRRVIARVEVGPQGADSRFIITNLAGSPQHCYEDVCCARRRAENLIKAHKLHLASDRISCSRPTANQFRLLVHRRLLADTHPAGLTPKPSFWRTAQLDTFRLGLIKVAARVTEMATRIKVALPSAFPYQTNWTLLIERTVRLPP